MVRKTHLFHHYNRVTPAMDRFVLGHELRRGWSYDKLKAYEACKTRICKFSAFRDSGNHIDPYGRHQSWDW